MPAAGATLLTLAACATPGADAFVRDDIITEPSPESFSVCHGGSCTRVTHAGLTDEQWRKIAVIFSPGPAAPGEERERIARAVALFETFAGELTGTSDDRPGNETAGYYWASQMDCIDESTNTTSYLRILRHKGLLRWHAVEARVTRGWFLFGWPHTTAVIRDTRSGERWAVDSFFFENGKPPVIVPLELWKTGWRPEKPPASAFP